MAEPAGWRPPWEDARTAGVPSAPPDGSRDPQAGRGHFRRYGRPGRWARGPGGPLRRAREDRLVGGVAAAIANRIGRDVTTVRIVLVVAAVLSGGFVAAAYIVAWMLIPMAGTEHSVAGKALTDRRGLALVAGFWSVLIVIRVLGEAFHAGWLGSLLWPLAIAGAGLVLIWRNAPEDEQAMIRHQVQPLLGLTTGSRRAGLILRLTVAVILLAGGIVALQSAHENIALLQPLAGVALLISAIVVLLGPWWLRIARDLVLERQARVRAEERADIAARVHDSVLQTLALIQRRADDPQKVVQLARLQERELRSWRSEGREPNEEAAELTVAAGVRHIQQDGELGVLLVRFPALEQPGAQLAFLQPGQLDDLLRVVRAPLDQRERLQHRVVHPGRDVGPLLRAHPGLALQHQVAGDPQPPRAEEQHDGRDHQHHPAERAQQRHAHVRREQPAHPADEQHAGQHQAKRGPPAAGPGARGRLQRLDQVPQRLLLLRRGVPPDQHQPGHAEHLRPGPADEPAAVERGERQQHQGEQRRQADGEPDAPGVGPGPAADAAVRAGRGQQQPARHVDRHEPSAGDQGGQHEHDPDGRGAEAPPRGHARGHAAAQPVGRVTAQRAAAARPPPQPERAAVPERAAGPVATAPLVAGPLVAVPVLRMLHGSIIAQSCRDGYPGHPRCHPDAPRGGSGGYRGSSPMR